jgi:hypothetical protein
LGGPHVGGFGGDHVGGLGGGHFAHVGHDHFGRRHYARGFYDYGLDCPYYPNYRSYTSRYYCNYDYY